MRLHLYPRLAAQNIVRQRRFFYPYILTVIGSAAAFYIVSALASDQGLTQLRGGAYAYTCAQIGTVILAFFCVIFLFYTNGFLMKRRVKELGLYNILGMGKAHIAAILTAESVILWAVGLGAGLLCGVLFHKLAALALFRLVRLDVPFGFEVSPTALARTAALFSLILAAVLLSNLVRVGRARPIELLQNGSAGEREPKTRWLLTLAGVASLGAGYAIALTVKNSMDALALYFVAVFFVIAGTYCLFTSVSIAVLKALRARKRFYYQTAHFINVSGMLYRMKQNAVGLANICILSTMVLVMVSGTLSLYLGVGDAVRTTIPADVVVNVLCDDGAPLLTQGGEALSWLRDYLRREGQTVSQASETAYLKFACAGSDGALWTDYERSGEVYEISWLTAQSYANASGASIPALQEGEALVSENLQSLGQTLTIYGKDGGQAAFRAAGTVPKDVISSLVVTNAVAQNACIVVADDAALEQVFRLQSSAYEQAASNMSWEAKLELESTAQEQLQNIDTAKLEEDFAHYLAQNGGYLRVIVSGRAEAQEELMSMAGGFLFLGVFLGLVFIMAAVLMIYYKQISEGYEDCERFRIMQQVGMEKRQIHSCINAQVLTVFFLPLAVCAVHLVFDFRMMTQLLRLFGIANTTLTAVCSAAVMGVFALLYAAVYLLTARTYNKIVAQQGR